MVFFFFSSLGIICWLSTMEEDNLLYYSPPGPIQTRWLLEFLSLLNSCGCHCYDYINLVHWAIWWRMITCFRHYFFIFSGCNTCFVYSYVYFLLTLFLIKLKFSICSPVSTLLLHFQMHENSVSFFLKSCSYLMSSNCSGYLFYLVHGYILGSAFFLGIPFISL